MLMLMCGSQAYMVGQNIQNSRYSAKMKRRKEYGKDL